MEEYTAYNVLVDALEPRNIREITIKGYANIAVALEVLQRGLAELEARRKKDAEATVSEF